MNHGIARAKVLDPTDRVDSGLELLLRAPLLPGEKAIDRARDIVNATRGLTEEERLAAIVELSTHPPKNWRSNRPGILCDFLEAHEWVVWAETAEGRLSPLGIEGRELCLYRQLFLEMAGRGGNRAAARSIVKTERLPVYGLDGVPIKEWDVHNIWFVPKENQRVKAAEKLLKFYRNRNRVLPAIEAALKEDPFLDWLHLYFRIFTDWAVRERPADRILYFWHPLPSIDKLLQDLRREFDGLR